MKYTYKDFATGKLHYTRGKFSGWITQTGLLEIRYAIFARPESKLFIPEYLLTVETRTILAKAS